MQSNYFNYSDKDSLGFLLWKTATLWQRMIKQSLKKYNITHPQFVVLISLLFFLENEDNNLNQSKLSKHTKIDKVTLSQIIKILQNKGFVQRVKNQNDNRSYIIKLTKKGINISVQSVKEVESIDKIFFEKLSELEKINIINYFNILSDNQDLLL
jgi:DNA-binding MarR family transcriptional regulator